MLDWGFSFEAVGRVAAWSAIVGFFASAGVKLFALLCGSSWKRAP